MMILLYLGNSGLKMFLPVIYIGVSFRITEYVHHRQFISNELNCGTHSPSKYGNECNAWIFYFLWVQLHPLIYSTVYCWNQPNCKNFHSIEKIGCFCHLALHVEGTCIQKHLPEMLVDSDTDNFSTHSSALIQSVFVSDYELYM